MLAITVKILTPTNHRGMRLKAYVAGNNSLGSITMNRNYASSLEADTRQAAQLLENKLAATYDRPANKMYGYEYVTDVWIYTKRMD